MKGIINSLAGFLIPDSRALRAIVLRALTLLSVFVICSVIAALGLGFLIWSLYLYLGTAFEPYTAALLSGGAAVIVSLLLVLAAVLLTGLHRRGKSGASSAPPPDDFDIDRALDIVRQHPLESGVTAAIAGFLAGSSSDARRTLTEFMLLFKGSLPK